MEWNKDAEDAIRQIPMPESMKYMTILYAEKIARKRERAKVSMDEVRQTGIDYRDLFGDTLMRGFREFSAKGGVDPEVSLNEGPKLYQFELCHMRFAGCTRQLVDVVPLAQKIDEKLREWRVTEMIADEFDVPFLPHTKFTVSISSCPNNCTAAEVKDIGIHGVAVPVFSHPEQCTQCGKCADICVDKAIIMEKDGPVIVKKHCSLCGACAIECPQGAMAIAERGYRMMVGGHFGRWHRIGRELFKLGDEEKVMKALEAAIELLRDKAGSEEHLYHLVDRYGLEPLYTKLI